MASSYRLSLSFYLSLIEIFLIPLGREITVWMLQKIVPYITTPEKDKEYGKLWLK
jgi:hypothetical protein